MANYDFKTLSPIDFEILVRDLLQKKFGKSLESFKQGKDQGIDLRYCSDSGKTLIIQCKHFAESNYKQLLRNLKEESNKVNSLGPTRYILATSLGLNPNNKTEIQDLFKPFIKNTCDIYGKEDINNLLTNFPEIEKQTFKLWLTSITILENLLQSKIINISRDAIKRIQGRAKLYVYNESFPEALNMLKNNNVCLIAGVPGIGKTMLAEMLLLDFIHRGYEVIKISNDISEAHKLIHHNVKRVYYYDDFLGQTALSEKLNKNEDQSLLDFIENTRKSEISKLILTTREYILNQARESYEKISRANFKPEIYTIDLSKYTREIRAKILYNHIYFSELDNNIKNNLLGKSDDLTKIIDHENYSPRIIEFMTQAQQLDEKAPEQYTLTFLSNLNNPSQIWKHAFEHQLTQNAKNLLLSMMTLPYAVELDDLKKAFREFHHHQAREHNQPTNPQDFTSALRELDGNFLRLEKSRYSKIYIEFHNPSIRDFMENYLSTSDEELEALIKTAIFYEQLEWFWDNQDNLSLGDNYSDKLKHKFSSLFLDKVQKLLFTPESCRYVNFSNGDGSTYKATYPKSFEEKIALIATINIELPCKKSKSLLTSALDYLENMIALKSANSEYLVREQSYS